MSKSVFCVCPSASSDLLSDLISQFGFGIVTLEDQQTSGCIHPSLSIPAHPSVNVIAHYLHGHRFLLLLLTNLKMLCLSSFR